MIAERILLVDDDPGFLALMTHVLRSEGRKLVTATDGVEALAEARANPPDLIILDVNMPRMDGFTLIRHLRSEPALALVPVIFLTGLSDVRYQLKGFQLGADDFLSKPVEPPQLAARVTSVLRRRSEIGEAFEKQIQEQDKAVFRGALDQIGLASLLTLLEMEGKTGTLRLRQEGSQETAHLALSNGRVLMTHIGGAEPSEPIGALAALLGWSNGLFEFTVGDPEEGGGEMESTTSLLMKAARFLDESGRR